MNNFGQPTIVAAVQTQPNIGNVQDNVSQAVVLATNAAKRGAKIVVLPELCTSGNAFNDISEAFDSSQTLDGWQTDAFLSVSQNNDCYVVFGFVELRDGSLYNSAAICGPYGIEGCVRKHNLYGRDNIWATPSTDVFPIINTPYGRLGALVCRDAMNNYRETYKFFKSQERFYRKSSVDIIALLTNYGHEYDYPDSGWFALVEELSANVIVSNRVGKERDTKYKGGSCVITRDSRVYTNGSTFDTPTVVGGVIVQ